MQRLDPAASERAALLASRIFKLISLDGIVTATVQVKKKPGFDLQTLHTMVAEMEDLLRHCAREARWAHRLVSDRKDEVLNNFSSLIETSPLKDEMKRKLRKIFIQEDRLIGTMAQAAEVLPGTIVSELERLRHEVATFESGKATRGDLDERTVCLLEGIGVGILALAGSWSAVALGIKMAADCF